MKVIELETKINESLKERGLNLEENALPIHDMMRVVRNLINDELDIVSKNVLNKSRKTMGFSWLHTGNKYYGTNEHYLYTNIEYCGLDGYMVNLGVNIDFEITRKLKYGKWYVPNIIIRFHGHNVDNDKNAQIEDIVVTALKDYRIKVNNLRQQKIKEEQEKEQKRLEHQKFVEAKTKEILDYVSKNNLDIDEFKKVASDYKSYCVNTI